MQSGIRNGEKKVLVTPGQPIVCCLPAGEQTILKPKTKSHSSAPPRLPDGSLRDPYYGEMV